MSLARKYRVRFGTPRGDRILLYFTTAVALHAGAATAGLMSWQEWRASMPPEAIASTPIEFVYINANDAAPEDTARRAQSNAKAQGIHQPNLPINAGKATVAPQKVALTKDASKAVDAATLNISGEVRPAQNSVAPASLPIAPPTDAKAITAESPAPIASPPPLVTPSLSTSISALPSDVAVAPVTVPPAPQVDPAAQPFQLPEPPEVPSPQAVLEAEEAIAPPESAPPEATPGSTNQSLAARTGLGGIPNPDRTGQDGPAQVAARQEALRGAYAAQVTEQVYEHWEQVPVTSNRQAKVRFEVDRQGNLLQLALIQSSGSPDADRAALEAVRNAAPFPTFNEEMSQARQGINMTFNDTISAPTLPSPTPSVREAEPTAVPHPQSE